MDVLGAPSESAKTSSSSVTVFTPGTLPEEEEKVPLIEPLQDNRLMRRASSEP